MLIAVFVAVLYSKTGESSQQPGAELRSSYSAVGLAYIIPGFIGVIAFCVRKKELYIAQMVLMIISLIGMVALFYFAFVIVVVDTQLQRPHCSGPPCDAYKLIYNLSVTIISCIVIGWVVSLAATITGGILACSRKQVDPQRGASTADIQMGLPRHPVSRMEI